MHCSSALKGDAAIYFGLDTSELHCSTAWGFGLTIRWSRVRVLSPEFKSSATLVNSQSVCLLAVGILNNFMFNLNYLFQSIAWPH